MPQRCAYCTQVEHIELWELAGKRDAILPLAGGEEGSLDDGEESEEEGL
jgi:hypothetical protein